MEHNTDLLTEKICAMSDDSQTDCKKKWNISWALVIRYCDPSTEHVKAGVCELQTSQSYKVELNKNKKDGATCSVFPHIEQRKQPEVFHLTAIYSWASSLSVICSTFYLLFSTLCLKKTMFNMIIYIGIMIGWFVCFLCLLISLCLGWTEVRCRGLAVTVATPLWACLQ